MKRLLAIVLLVCTTVLSLTGCGLFDYITSVYSNVTGYKSYAKGRRHDLNAKVQSDKNVFDLNDVTLDFYYSLYCFDHYESIEDVRSSFYWDIPEESETYSHYSRQFVHAIFIGDSNDLAETYQGFHSSFDEFVNARSSRLYKFISFEEAFITDYGYTTEETGLFSKKIIYHHKEQLTIPAEMFSKSRGSVYIYLVRIVHKLSTNEYVYGWGDQSVIQIKYELLENNKVRLD